jgi:hypothetical protein
MVEVCGGDMYWCVRSGVVFNYVCV